LVKAEAEQDLERWFLRAPAGFALDHPIQGGLPADGPKDQFLEQAAVRRSQRMMVQRIGEMALDIIGSLRCLPQNMNGNLSWFCPNHA
jgi:hypothetical protein